MLNQPYGQEARTLPIHQKIAQELGVLILRGKYLPGHALNGEIEQSILLGVSRTPYREAIRVLVAKGLVESRPGIGTHVTAREAWNLLDPDVLAWMFAGNPNEDFVRDLFQVRSIFEPAAAEMAARRHGRKRLEAMRTALLTMQDYGLDSIEGQIADQEFHSAMLVAAGNQVMASLSRSMAAVVHWTAQYKRRCGMPCRDAIPDYEAVYGYIEVGNGLGAAISTRHVLSQAKSDIINSRPTFA